MFNKMSLFISLLLSVLATPINAAVMTYSSQADFIAALGGVPVVSQNFDSYSHMDTLDGVIVLPGISATSNQALTEAWDPTNDGDVNMFAHGGDRSLGNAYYEISFAQAYNAFALDIDSYNPEAAIRGQHGVMEVTTTDGLFAFDITQTGALESDPIFFGVISTGNILTIRWNEGPEISGTGNEETGLDNFMATNVVVPIPAALPLMLSGLVAMSLLGRRKIH